MEEMETMPGLEDVYLSELVRKGKPVKIILRNGYQMICVIEDFDNNVLVVKNREERWLVYRQNLSTIVLEQLLPNEKAGGKNG